MSVPDKIHYDNQTVAPEETEVLTDAKITDYFKEWIDLSFIDSVTSQAFADNPNFVIDYNKIISFNPHDLVRYFNEDLDRAIACLKVALSEKMIELADLMHENNNNKPDNLQVHLQNYTEPILLRDINTIHNKKMIVVNCIISKTSEEKPFMTKSVYLCAECGHHEPSPKNKYLKFCPSCEAEGRMVLDIDKCVFTSYRNIVIQDLPEDLPAGQLPASKPVVVFGSSLTHTERCRAGSRIKLTAIVRLAYDRNTLDDIKNNQDPLGILDAPSTGTTFSLSLTANNIEALGDSEALQRHQKLTDEDIERIESLKKNPKLNELLVSSYAPHIYGHNIIKECMLLAIASSSIQSNEVKKRGDINVLLVGNAGVAKSQMMLYGAKISPRCIYVSGRGTSAVGLTAAVNRDDKTGAMMLEAGACVLADQGTLIIDEFDKLRADDRSALHEVMEQQTVSVAKGGIVATLNARISILAAANPKYGTYDSYKTLAENTEYPPSLLTRFDFIFVIKDKIDKEHDAQVADKILGDIKKDSNIGLDIASLSKYIQHIKTKPDPKLTSNATKAIQDYYVKIRQLSEKDKDDTAATITVTARIVDTLMRTAKARAKLLQKEEVDEDDVNRIIFLLSKMYESFGVMIPLDNDNDLKENTKNIPTINLGLLYGRPATKVSKRKVFIDICDGMTNYGKIKEIDIEHLIFELVNSRKFVTRYDAEDFIKDATREGILSQKKGSIYTYDRDMVMQS